jgi:hypothetical protein
MIRGLTLPADLSRHIEREVWPTQFSQLMFRQQRSDELPHLCDPQTRMRKVMLCTWPRERGGKALPGAAARGPHRDARSRAADGGRSRGLFEPVAQRGRVPQAPTLRGTEARGKKIGDRPTNQVCPRFSSRHWGRRRRRAAPLSREIRLWKDTDRRGRR